MEQAFNIVRKNYSLGVILLLWITYISSGFAIFLLFVEGALRLYILSQSDADFTVSSKEIKPEYLKGKVVWITGASGGIGESVAYEFCKHGAILVLSARRESVIELEKVKNNCKGPNSEEIMVLPMDMLDLSKHQELVDQVVEKFGKIDILFNNAGRTQRACIEKTDIAVTEELFNLNVLSVISLTKNVLPVFLKQKSGHFITSSSVAGKMISPVSSTYVATKFAIQGYFKTLESELSYHNNIYVTLMCPGPVDTDIAINAASEKVGVVPESSKNESGETKMSPERAAYLYAVATTNQLRESWISNNPILGYVYLFCYCERLFGIKSIGPKGGAKRRHLFENGGDVNVVNVLK